MVWKNSIKEVPQIVRLPSHTLRYYEGGGFLSKIRRDAAGRRVYSEQDLANINPIKCLRFCGLSFRRLKRFFACYHAAVPAKERQELLNEFLQALKDK